MKNKICLKFGQKLYGAIFSSKISTRNLTHERIILAFINFKKKYAETTLLDDEKYISQEASYTPQQIFRRVEPPKTCVRETNFA